MMATTELDKIPETVLSRSQVYEFRTISSKMIGDQLRRIVDAEGIDVADQSLQLIARDADGSMRDAQSKLDQVIAFTGKTISVEDVSTVLGLVGRDLLLDALQAVADEDAAAAFTLAGKAVEMGYDLRLVCRELARVVRDLLVLSVDPARAGDPEIAGESERDRLLTLAKRFSREDLLRAFDVMTKAEADIRSAAQPRYHLEMALLRWIYLRKLVSLEDLMSGAPAAPARPAPVRAAVPAAPPAPSSKPAPPERPVQSAPPPRAAASEPAAKASFKDALLSQIRSTKGVFYNTVVAQAQKIEVTPDQIIFTFSASQKTLREMLEQNRGWLESLAQQLAGHKVTVVSANGSEGNAGEPAKAPVQDKKAALREQALANEGVQTLLEVLPVEIRDVEEI
jgi:DNA polymerase-3 subunit gamma/tau